MSSREPVPPIHKQRRRSYSQLRWIPGCVLFLALAMVLLWLQGGWITASSITYGDFMELVNGDKVRRVTFHGKGEIRGQLRDWDNSILGTRFTVSLPPGYDTDDLVKYLHKRGVDIWAEEPRSVWGSPLVLLLSAALLLWGIGILRRLFRPRAIPPGAGPRRRKNRRRKPVHPLDILYFQFVVLVTGASVVVIGLQWVCAASLWALLLTPVIFILSIVAHEAGHVVAAWAGRAVVFQVALGPFLFVRRQQGVRCSFDRVWLTRPMGYVAGCPVEPRNLARRFCFFAAGGPLASLAAGLICLGIALLCNEKAAELEPPGDSPVHTLATYFNPQTLAPALWMIAAVVNLRFFVLSAVPRGIAGWANDSYLILAWLRAPGLVEKTWILNRLAMQMAQGRRPRDWDLALVARLLALCEPKATGGLVDHCCSVANLYGYYHALDRDHVEQAGVLLDQALARCQDSPSAWRRDLCLEASYFAGLFRDDAATARKWFEDMGTAGAPENLAWRAWAAVLTVEGEYTEARDAALRALRGLRDWEVDGTSMAFAAWLHTLLLDLQKKQAVHAELVAEAADFKPSSQI
jgi:Zn-dependent protease